MKTMRAVGAVAMAMVAGCASSTGGAEEAVGSDAQEIEVAPRESFVWGGYGRIELPLEAAGGAISLEAPATTGSLKVTASFTKPRIGGAQVGVTVRAYRNLRQQYPEIDADYQSAPLAVTSCDANGRCAVEGTVPAGEGDWTLLFQHDQGCFEPEQCEPGPIHESKLASIATGSETKWEPIAIRERSGFHPAHARVDHLAAPSGLNTAEITGHLRYATAQVSELCVVLAKNLQGDLGFDATWEAAWTNKDGCQLASGPIAGRIEARAFDRDGTSEIYVRGTVSALAGSKSSGGRWTLLVQDRTASTPEGTGELLRFDMKRFHRTFMPIVVKGH